MPRGWICCSSCPGWAPSSQLRLGACGRRRHHRVQLGRQPQRDPSLSSRALEGSTAPSPQASISSVPPHLCSPLQHLVRTGKARVVHRAGWGLAPKPGSSSEGGRHATCKHTEVKKPPPWRDGGLLIGKGRGYHHPTGKRFELKFLPTSR